MSADKERLKGGYGKSDKRVQRADPPSAPVETPRTGRARQTPLDDVVREPPSALEEIEARVRGDNAERVRGGVLPPEV